MVVAALFALCAPVAVANHSMDSPQELELNSKLKPIFSDDSDLEKRGTEPGEPLTPGSGSVCRDSEDWTLISTQWYEFKGTGGPVVVRFDGPGFLGGVLYQADGIPTIDDAIGCVRLPSPRRFELETQAGHRYLLQIGSKDTFSAFQTTYSIDLATSAQNRDRARAIEMPFGTTFQMNNFGGTLDPYPGTCATNMANKYGGYAFFGGRGVWAKIDVPSTGNVRVELEPEEVDPLSPISLTMIELYAEDQDTPLACAAGPLKGLSNLTTELNATVGPGNYWLRFMTAIEPGPAADRTLSAEERWAVTAHFSLNLVDGDRDGHFQSSDCRDDDATIHSGAVDVPDNGIDENCDGQDARRDFDEDGVPDYKDRCPARSSKGIDSNRDGCRDPRQLPLTAQLRLTLSSGRLHVTSLFVHTDPGARVVLSCGNAACRTESKLMHADQAQFGAIFQRNVPDGTELSISATKPGHLGLVKQYRLSTAGVRLLRQWCTKPGGPRKKTPCG